MRDDPQVREKLAKQRMKPVQKEDGERMAKDLGAVKYVECSALTQYKLKHVFDEVSQLIFLASDFKMGYSYLRTRLLLSSWLLIYPNRLTGAILTPTELPLHCFRSICFLRLRDISQRKPHR